MQKNAFHEIWTWLSRKVLREIRVYDYSKVQETAFYVFSRDNPEDHNRKKREWLFSID